MADDDDFAGLIPESPPPDGDRRSAAIEAALRRFDAGIDDPREGAGTDHVAWKRRLGKRQLTVLASALLVVLVSVPVLLPRDGDLSRVDEAGEADRRSAIEPTIEPENPPPSIHKEAQMAEAESDDTHLRSADSRTTAMDVMPERHAAANEKPSIAADAVTGTRSNRNPVPAEQRFVDQAAVPAPAAPDLAFAPPSPPPNRQTADDETSRIVVTGTRVSSFRDDARSARPVTSRPTGRRKRQWQACTVADPRKNIRRCSEEIEAALPTGSPAAANIKHGLALAWQGDDEGAMRAFDAAIAQAPQSGSTLLNRGILRQRCGDLDDALADLTAAAEMNPDDARVFYFRSLLYREKGMVERADQDIAVAIGLAEH